MTESGAGPKSADAYRTISEVAADLKLPQHVLRFWETRFSQVKPLKRAGGRRFYRPEDVDLLRAVKALLYSDGYTIKGVQRLLREQGPRAVAALAASPTRRGGARTSASKTGEPEIDVLPPRSTARLDHAPAAVPLAESESGPAAELTAAGDASARLRALLTELADCARLLDGARTSSR